MPASNNERVLVLAPTSADAGLSRLILTEAGLESSSFRSLTALALEIDHTVAAVLLTEEVFVAPDVPRLLEALRRQPPWSDLPVILLSGAGADSAAAAWAIELLGNITVLERPVRLTTLASAVRTAIRARRRQYELRDQFVDLERAAATLRIKSERQRLLGEAAAILLSTDEPDAMMHALYAKVATHFGLDAYFNYRLNDVGDVLWLESFDGISSDEARASERLELGEAVSGLVAQQWQSFVASNMQSCTDP